MDGAIREFRVGGWNQSRVVRAHPKSANTLSFHPDEGFLTSGCSDGTASVWRWPELEKHVDLPAKTGASSWFAPLGDRLVTRALNGRIIIWSWPEPARIGEVRAHPKKATAHTFTEDGEAIVTGGLEGSIAVTRLTDGRTIATKSLGSAPIVNVAFMPDSGHLLVFLHNAGAHLLAWPDLHEVASADLERAGVYTIAFHPSEEVFAVCVEHGVEVRRNATLERLTTLEIPAKGVYTLAFSPDDLWLAAAGADQRIRVWSMTP
jgi:WD40 repeat protein